jgi:hypothetical protein
MLAVKVRFTSHRQSIYCRFGVYDHRVQDGVTNFLISSSMHPFQSIISFLQRSMKLQHSDPPTPYSKVTT